MTKNMTPKAAIEEFQCPGCVCGSDTSCGEYTESPIPGQVECVSHVPGTSMLGGPRILLGLPKGYNRLARGCLPDGANTPVRIFASPEATQYDELNIPVWATDVDGAMLARTVLPRLGVVYVDVVIDGESSKLAPHAADPSGMDID